MGAGASASEDRPSSDALRALAERFGLNHRLCVLHGLSSAAGSELNGRLGEVMRIDARTGRLCVSLLPQSPVEGWKKIRPENVRPSALQVSDASAICSICLEGASEDDGVLVHPCSCRGHSGATHLLCLQRAYGAQVKQRSKGMYPTCATCRSQYDGKVAVTLLLAHQASINAAVTANRVATSTTAHNAATSAATAASDVTAAASTAAVEAPSALHPSQLETGPPVLISGLTTATHLNGQRGWAITQVPSSGRWLVQLDDGSIKAIREGNLQHAQGGADGGDGVRGGTRANGVANSEGVGISGSGHGGSSSDVDAASLRSFHGALGLAYRNAGQPAQASQCLKELVQQTELTYGAEHPSLCPPLTTLGAPRHTPYPPHRCRLHHPAPPPNCTARPRLPIPPSLPSASLADRTRRVHAASC